MSFGTYLGFLLFLHHFDVFLPGLLSFLGLILEQELLLLLSEDLSLLLLPEEDLSLPLPHQDPLVQVAEQGQRFYHRQLLRFLKSETKC